MGDEGEKSDLYHDRRRSSPPLPLPPPPLGLLDLGLLVLEPGKPLECRRGEEDKLVPFESRDEEAAGRFPTILTGAEEGMGEPVGDTCRGRVGLPASICATLRSGFEKLRLRFTPAKLDLTLSEKPPPLDAGILLPPAPPPPPGSDATDPKGPNGCIGDELEENKIGDVDTGEGGAPPAANAASACCTAEAMDRAEGPA